MSAPAKTTRLRAAFIVGAIALVVCMGGILLLAFGLVSIGQGPAWEDNANQPIHTVSQDVDETISDGASSPLWLTDTRGIDLPTDCISSEDAFGEVGGIAESVFGATPYGRAYALLRTDYHIDSYYFDVLGDLFWDVTMETSEGLVHVWIDARSGMDFNASITPSDHLAPDYWDFFEAWRESGSESEPSGRFGFIGDEQRRAAEEQAPISAYEFSSKDRNELQREYVAELAARAALLPYSEEALRLVDEAGLGNDARTVSTAVCAEGDHAYTVDVELSDGSHLFCELSQSEPIELKSYERHNASLVDLRFPL